MPYEKLKKPPIPSVANFWVNLLCVVIFFAFLFIFVKLYPKIHPFQLTCLALFGAVVPLWLYDFFGVKVHKRASVHLKENADEIDFSRVTTKLIGFFGTMLIVLGIYLCINSLHKSLVLETFFSLLRLLAPVIVLGGIVYFVQIDRRQKAPYDEYWQMGCLLTGRFKEVNSIVIKEHVRVWAIKAFFTPFVFGILVKYVGIVLTTSWHKVSFFFIFSYILNVLYAVDILYGVLGYILTCRLMDTHIRSTEPTFLGWLVCLMCYGPIHSHFGIGLFNYDDGFTWNVWLVFDSISFHFIGITIILLTLVYTLATVAIGYRMSNLTYRGIITSGPYRFSKHPAYVCKVASWWLITLPFLSVDGASFAIKHTLALCFISFIYFMRAKTEENHLSNYPEYVEYANWINKHGALSGLMKRFPQLQYSEEKAKKWSSVVWFHKLNKT